MIGSISQLSPQALTNNNSVEQFDVNKLKTPDSVELKDFEGLKRSAPSEPFGNVLGQLVKDVAEKQQVAEVETNKMLLGETDNIHQSMIAVQEAGLAFTTLVEVRNKLVTSYQELMRMPV
ncbi:flagellar hook-basal body complex protein FliE [Puniceicoccaceae bacterium K14]|nr:flagellar hook-basal body complex protein FliE [Puniceicoccaceae bacterium K14]